MAVSFLLPSLLQLAQTVKSHSLVSQDPYGKEDSRSRTLSTEDRGQICCVVADQRQMNFISIVSCLAMGKLGSYRASHRDRNVSVTLSMPEEERGERNVLDFEVPRACIQYSLVGCPSRSLPKTFHHFSTHDPSRL